MKTLIREYRASDLEGLLNTWELATRLAGYRKYKAPIYPSFNVSY